MNNKLISQEWYRNFIDECHALIITKVNESREAILEAHHGLGTLIIKENGNFEREKIYGDKIVQCIAESLKISVRNVYYSIEFARKFPNLEDVYGLPEGLNISWSKVCKHHLLENKPSPCDHQEHEVIQVKVCKQCKKKIAD